MRSLALFLPILVVRQSTAIGVGLTLLWLSGCIQVHRPSCETETRELGDEEVIGDLAVSAADLMALMEGEFSFAGSWPDGAPVTGTTRVARGEGPVVGTDGTVVDTVTNGGFGIGEEMLLVGVICTDSIAVPVEITLATGDGIVDLAVSGSATADDQGLVVDGVPEFMFAGASFSYDESITIPAPDDPSDTGGVEVQFSPSAFDFVSVWWTGSDYQQIFEAPATRP